MDDRWLYSARLADVDPTDCNPQIQAAIQELRTVFGKGGLRVVHWNDSYVGIAITVQVKIPTRGPVGGVDIREQEPILLLLHKTRYPHEAPRVCSDRLGFPAERLPHLNPVLPGQPASLCLHRGNINDWFTEHSLISLVERTQGWLRDAASARLIREHDRFEPTRTEIERRVGVAIYDPADLESFIRACWATGQGQGAAALLCWLPGSANQDPSLKGTPFPIRVHTACSMEQAVQFRAKVEELNRLQGKLGEQTDRGLVGLLVWPDEDRICGDYFGTLPNTLASLNQFAERLGLPLRNALNQYLAEGLQLLGGIPVILAVQRPQPLIGSESPIELLNLVLCAGGDHWPDEEGWKPDTPVLLLGNRIPVTVRLARELSAVPTGPETPRVLLLGCGALGSKVGLHLARAGLTGLTLVDNDDLSPHNLIRHGLLADSVGENKAEAVRKSIETIFRDDLTSVRVDALPRNALDVLFGEHNQLLQEHDWILDCSASASVLNALADPRLAQAPPVMRAEIADRGRLSFLLIEGVGRNPRVDDLQMTLYDRAIEDHRVSAWLRRQRQDTDDPVGPALEQITIGLGCSSATMRMADDVISYHASVAAMTIRDRLTDQAHPSGIQISFWDRESTSRGVVEFMEVPKFRTLIPHQGSGWKVRLSEKLYAQLLDQMRAASPNETGGLLVGFIHHKRKIIYVTRALEPPPDSKGWPYAFRLGVRDAPERLEEIHERTGGVIGYVGEWHSHPNGPGRLSSRDKAAVRQISAHLKAAGLPTHIMVVTPKGCFPHLFHHR